MKGRKGSFDHRIPSQHVERRVEAGLDGTQRDIERVRDLLEIEVVDESEADDFAVALGQGGEEMLDGSGLGGGKARLWERPARKPLALQGEVLHDRIEEGLEAAAELERRKASMKI